MVGISQLRNSSPQPQVQSDFLTSWPVVSNITEVRALVLANVQLLSVGRWFPPGTPVSSTTEPNISSS